MRLWFGTIFEKQLPELSIFFALSDCSHFWTCSLVLLEQLDVLLGGIHVGLNVSLWNLGSLPDVDWYVVGALNDKHGSWIEFLIALVTVELVNLHSG